MQQDLTRILEENAARFVRVLMCDNANVIRAKAIHVAALSGYLAHGVGISRAQQALPVMADMVVPGAGLGPIGEIRLMPDWNTLTPLPYAPGHMRVMGDMILDGRPWPLCPRDFLKRMIAVAAEEGFQVKAAFENEFYLLRAAGDEVVSTDDTVFGATLSMDLNHQVIDAIVEALVKQGMPVEMYYPESGPGQQEISIRYTDALAAADRQIAFRETVHAVAHRHGFKASFLPKIFADQAGNGCHLHLSLWRGEENAFADADGVGGLAPVALHFIAGMLHHLPALMAVTTPSPNSYLRIRPHCWSGAFRCWGLDNREAAIRVPTNPAGTGTTNIELKTVDASSNPYLALGAVIAVGLDGVRRKLDPGPPLQVDPGNMGEEERRRQEVAPLPVDLGAAIESFGGDEAWRHALIDELPTDLRAAIDQFGGDEVLQEALGPELARAFLAIRRAEWQALGDLELADQVKILLERY